MWDEETQLWLPTRHLCIVYVASYDRHIRTEDVDQDGVNEIIREFRCRDEIIVIFTIDEDGTIIREEYTDQKELIERLKIDPEGNHFVWDEETQQWIPVQHSSPAPLMLIN